MVKTRPVESASAQSFATAPTDSWIPSCGGKLDHPPIQRMAKTGHAVMVKDVKDVKDVKGRSSHTVFIYNIPEAAQRTRRSVHQQFLNSFSE